MTGRTIVSALLAVGLTIPAVAGEPPAKWVEGVVILRVESDFYVDLSDALPTNRLGIAGVDDYFARLHVDRLMPRFPTAREAPIPGGVDLRPIYEVHYWADVPVPQAAMEMEALAGVAYACPAYIYEVFLDHNDPLRDQQYALDLISANVAHDITTGSREVVIAITDTGIDLDHPDLLANLWVNPGEDLDQDGVIQENEVNGQDDDNDGKVDDFYGWDLAQDDNSPDDTFGHGTLVAGAASAVTNNETGVASIGYSCALMIVRVGPGPQIPQGIPGIVYAVDAGADVINCSWGSYQPSDEGRDAVAYAYDHDVVFVAAAGNSGSTVVGYPAGYDHAIAVAATDQNDVKAGFSSYGDWVDISAPGVDVLSTAMGGDYDVLSGTSASSPLVAGAAALIRSEYPDLDADVVADMLRYGADNIDAQNGGLEGLLGGGRLNAEQAIRIIEQPLIIYGGATLVAEDNRNGRLDPGETASIVATVINRGHSPDTLTMRMTTEDPDITILYSEVVCPNIGPGERFSNSQEPFIFEIAAELIPHTTRLTITIDAQPGDYHSSNDLPMLIGHPTVLIVDDDGGLNYETYLQRSIERMRQGWLSWDCTQQPRPSPDTLRQFRMVVWETGAAFPALDDMDRWTIAQAISRGANIILTGRYIGDDNANNVFLRLSFDAQHVLDSVAVTTVNSLGGHRPIEPGVVMHLDGRGGSGDGMFSPSTVSPLLRYGDSLLVYHYLDPVSGEDQVTGVAAVYREDPDSQAKCVYMGFTFESVSDLGTSRHVVLEQLLSWIAPDLAAPAQTMPTPPIDYSLSPAYPNPFNGMVSLNYRLGNPAPFRLVVRDLAGREVETLAQGWGVTGSHTALWDASGAASGLYFARLEAGGSLLLERQMVLVK